MNIQVSKEKISELGSWLAANSELISAVSDMLVPALGIVIAFLAFRWNRRKDRLAFIEQSFNDLQAINQLVLEDKENLLAALDSIWPEEQIDDFEARKIYLHYVRINRLYRTWNYAQQGVISKKQAQIIVQSYASVLKHHEKYLDVMLILGYPEGFKKFLINIVSSAKPMPPLFTKIELDKSSSTKSA